MSPATRVLAPLAGLLVGAAALWGVLWVSLFASYAAEHPDPDVPNGDPCCGHPDTWGDVLEGSAFTAGFAVLDGLLFVLAIALLRHAVRDRGTKRRWFLIVPALYAVAAILAIAIAQLTQL